MKPTERRLRALEQRASQLTAAPPPRVIVKVGETLEAALIREGVEPQVGSGIALIARMMQAPKPCILDG